LSEALSVEYKDLNENLHGFLQLAKDGTCRWHEKRDWYQRWLHGEDSEPQVLWIDGPLASGKSVLAACITESIRDRIPETAGGACLYHSFSFENKAKRTVAYLFRSLAFQVGLQIPRFRDSVIQLAKDFGVSFGSMDAIPIWEKIFSGVLLKMTIARPIYCIVDGLDEADSVQPLLRCLGRLRSPTVVLKILFMSRPSRPVEEALADLRLGFFRYSMTPLDTRDDIRNFVEKAMQSSAVPPDSRAQVIKKILDNASGNFLWVSLATKTITQNWHFHSSIESALNTLPNGMKSLYSRTLQKLEEHPNKLRKLASVILTWTTFSFRPLLLSELKEAVRVDFADVVSLENIINHVCSDFVQIRGPKIRLVHETARSFLIDNPYNSPALMDPSRAHTYLTTICVRTLSSTKDRPWRNILGLIEARYRTEGMDRLDPAWELDREHPFLLYTARYWTYHLSLSQPEDQELLNLLTDFFKYDVRNWIYTLALIKDLTTLVKSAQYLKTFIKRIEARHKKGSQKLLSTAFFDQLRLWAVDLGKLVGKFGNNLIERPSSIFNLIPHFCPDSSMIKKSRGTASSHFSVTGIINSDWDDLQARLCPDPEKRASKLLVTTESIAVMIPQAGEVQIWQSETFLPMRRIQHGEYLAEMAVSKEGYLILTAGRYSLKVWEIKTGRLWASHLKANDSRVVGATFDSNETHILIGYADHLIACLNWRTGQYLYSFRAPPHGDASKDVSLMRFSPDCRQVALMSRSYPVEIWDVRSGSRAYKCVLSGETMKAENEIGLSAEAIEWHPNSERIYVLYHTTGVVDFCPFSGEQTEHHIGAKEMACSPKGSYLLTSNHEGTLKVYSLPDYATDEQRNLQLVYQLNKSDVPKDLAFNTSEQRIYDIRDIFISCYEPDALLLLEEPDPNEERQSQTGSLPSTDPVVVSSNEESQITALSSAPNDFGYCCGREGGKLSIHEMTTGKLVRSLAGHADDTDIVAVAWSSSGQWIASGDESGSVVVRKVLVPSSANDKMWVWKPSGFHIEDGINQLLFSSNDQYLLVSTAGSSRIWDVVAKKTRGEQKHSEGRQMRWFQHPADPKLLVSIHAQEVHIFDWHTFKELSIHGGLRLIHPGDDAASASEPRITVTPRGPNSLPMETLTLNPSPSLPVGVVNCVMRTGDQLSIILEMIPAYTPSAPGSTKLRYLELLRTSELAISDKLDFAHATALAPQVEVAKLVGSYKNQAVFFDHRHWLCTCDLNAPAATLKEHFFLPRDWLVGNALDLCAVTAQGTVLCPRNGEVAIIRNGIHA
jgi:WD40 repeat protein